MGVSFENSIAFEGMLSFSLLSMMGSKVCTSAGAACHSSDGISISEVLRAIRCPLSFAIGTLRLSVGRYTTKKDVEEAAEVIIAAVYKLLEEPSFNQKVAWEMYNIDPGRCSVCVLIVESIYNVPKVVSDVSGIALDEAICNVDESMQVKK